MKKLSVYKDSVLTNELQFESQEALESGIAYHESIGSFLLFDKVIPAVLDLEGNELVPQTVEVATHSHEVLDITNQVNQEEVNRQALEYLASTDYLVIRFIEEGTPYSQEIKDLRTQARLSVVR